jgi:hypothetical protein
LRTVGVDQLNVKDLSVIAVDDKLNQNVFVEHITESDATLNQGFPTLPSSFFRNRRLPSELIF